MGETMNCLLCPTPSPELSARALSAHLQHNHGLKTGEYTWRHLLGLERPPVCAAPGCEEEPRYVSFGFRKFCRTHFVLSAAESGHKGLGIKRPHHRPTPVVPALPPSPGEELFRFVLSLCPDALQTEPDLMLVESRKVAVWFRDLAIIEPDVDPRSRQARESTRKAYDSARSHDVRLVQLFSDEWRDRRPIVESMLRNRLGVLDQRIGARKCELVELEKPEGRAFFESSHIDGNARASFYFGLRHPDGTLISASSVRTPIQKKHGRVSELARFATRPGWLVPGGAGRLLKHALEHTRARGFEGMLSYADLRFGEGDVYRQLGFQRLGDTGMAYFYTDGKDRLDRFKFRAQQGMSEREWTARQGVRPVYTPGHAVYLLKF
jgi:GNAT superfamily N-acetyltransferase